MLRNVRYRHRLLHAVNMLLEQTSTSQERAHRILRICRSTIAPFTIDDVIWGPSVSALMDPENQRNAQFLMDLRNTLLGTLPSLQRTYIRYDFKLIMNASEIEWRAAIIDLMTLLGTFPFVEFDRAAMQYDERRKLVEGYLSRPPRPIRPGVETIYHMILREVSAIVTSIDLRMSTLKAGYLAPTPPYSSIRRYDLQYRSGYPPDATGSLAWAKRALDAINGDDWVLVTWEIHASYVRLSLH